MSEHPNPSRRRRTRLQGRDHPEVVHSGRYEDPAVRAKDDAEAQARLERLEVLRERGVSEEAIARAIIAEGKPKPKVPPLLLGDAEVVQ